MHAYIFRIYFQDFAYAIGFCFIVVLYLRGYRKQILVLISACMRRCKIRFRYDTTSWFTDSPIASAMSCPQMPTAGLLPHNAPRSVVTPQGSDRAEVARGGACTYLYVGICCTHIHTYLCMYVRVCLNVGFDATA